MVFTETNRQGWSQNLTRFNPVLGFVSLRKIFNIEHLRNIGRCLNWGYPFKTLLLHKNETIGSKINSNEKKKRKVLNLSMKLSGNYFRKSRSPKIVTEGPFEAAQKFSNCNCKRSSNCPCTLIRMILEHNRLTL